MKRDQVMISKQCEDKQIIERLIIYVVEDVLLMCLVYCLLCILLQE